MLIAHRIELAPDVEQEAYFRQACGTDRFTWNWALAEWNRQFAAGQKPSAPALKRKFNTIKYHEFPWLNDIHRDAHADAFARIGKAWKRFFTDLRKGEKGHPPVFKRKGRCQDSFYIANDKLTLDEWCVRLPVIGWVRLKEAPRFGGKVMGATVIREAHKWYLAVQFKVEVSWLDNQPARPALGVDLNVKAIVCSDGSRFETPQALKRETRRLRIRQRRLSRKLEAAKQASGFASKDRLPKGTRLPQSNNRLKSARRLAATHLRVKNLRSDFQHKTTSAIVRKSQATVIEDLSVKGMTASAAGTPEIPGKKVRQKAGLNRAVLDVGFYEIRRQIEYKNKRIGHRTLIADRWFPSSKLCSTPGCGYKNTDLKLHHRNWTCPQCGTSHDRDENASINLERLATEPERFVALPEAIREVTPVRHESKPVRSSGQEASLRKVRQSA